MHEELHVGFEPHLHEVLQSGHQFAGEDEHESPLHEEELQVGHQIDLNMDPGTSWSSTPLFSLFMCTCWWFFFAIEDELEPDIAHGEEEHDADVARGEENLVDHELEGQGGVFQSMEEEVQAMDEALHNLRVDEEDYGVYAGDIEIQFEEEELDDSADEAMYDSAPEEDITSSQTNWRLHPANLWS